MQISEWPRRPWLVFGGVLVFYLALRLPALMAIPLFNDEALYITHALRFPAMLSDSLGEGKLLQALVLALLVHLPGDPLLYSRLFSVACGMVTMVGLFLCGRMLANPVVGLLAALLYALAPLAELHERLGLPDSMLTSFVCVIVMVSVRFAQHPHPTRTQAMVLGGLIGLSALAKFYGLLFVSIPVLAILLLSVDRKQRLAFVPTLVICALLPIVVLAPFHYGGYERDKAEFTGISSRIAALTQNGVLLSEWFTSYLPLPLLIPPLLFIVVGWRQRNAAWQRIVFLVGAALCLPVILFFFGNTLYSRYLMSSWPMLLLACAFSIKELWSLPWARATCIVALGTALLWDGLFTIQLLRDPLQAPLVADDRRQYLETWSSGYGLSEVLDLSRQEAIRRHGILLINHDQPRLIHFSAMIYLRDDPLIQQTTLDITDPDSPLKAQQLAAKTPTYVLLDQQERDVYAFTTHFSNIRLVGQGQNPLGTMTFYLYEQLPPR